MAKKQSLEERVTKIETEAAVTRKELGHLRKEVAAGKKESMQLRNRLIAVEMATKVKGACELAAEHGVTRQRVYQIASDPMHAPATGRLN